MKSENNYLINDINDIDILLLSYLILNPTFVLHVYELGSPTLTNTHQKHSKK